MSIPVDIDFIIQQKILDNIYVLQQNTTVMRKLPSKLDPKVQSENEMIYYKELEKYFNKGTDSVLDKITSFAKYVPRQYLTLFLSRYEIFKKILNVHGSIIECGVFNGQGTMTFAHLSSILEPINHNRRIIGFDTFAGFKKLTKIDRSKSSFAHKGGFSANSYEDLKKCIELYDLNRFLRHVPKVELVKGDILKTVPEYLRKNPQTVVSLLYLDVNLYEPTKIALKHFVPRMPKGSIIAFDELNSEMWPGETQAVLDKIGINNLKIERFYFEPNIGFAILD